MATAFNDRHLKSVHSQSKHSQHDISTNSARSKSGFPRNKLAQHERMNTHSSFHDSDRRQRIPSNEGNLSFNEDYLAHRPREPFVGGPTPSGHSASRRSSVEKDVNGVFSRADSQKSSRRAYLPLPKHPSEIKAQTTGETTREEEPATQQNPKHDESQMSKTGKIHTDEPEDGRVAGKIGHNLHKDQPKFTNHEWPQNKAYVDVTKLKAEHIVL